MFGLRATARRLRERLVAAQGDNRRGASAFDANSAVIMRALHRREAAGKSTTLRQLHLVAQLSQPEALRAIAELECEGRIVIEHDLHDALESPITLAPGMRSQASAKSRPDPA